MTNRHIPSVIAVCVVVNSIIDHAIDPLQWDQKQLKQLVHTGFSVLLRSSAFLFAYRIEPNYTAISPFFYSLPKYSIKKCMIKAVHFHYVSEVCAGPESSVRAYWTIVDYRNYNYKFMEKISELYISGNLLLNENDCHNCKIQLMQVVWIALNSIRNK